MVSIEVEECGDVVTFAVDDNLGSPQMVLMVGGVVGKGYDVLGEVVCQFVVAHRVLSGEATRLFIYRRCELKIPGRRRK